MVEDSLIRKIPNSSNGIWRILSVSLMTALLSGVAAFLMFGISRPTRSEMLEKVEREVQQGLVPMAIRLQRVEEDVREIKKEQKDLGNEIRRQFEQVMEAIRNKK